MRKLPVLFFIFCSLLAYSQPVVNRNHNNRVALDEKYDRPVHRQLREGHVGSPPTVSGLAAPGGNGSSQGNFLLHNDAGAIYLIGSYQKEITLGSINLTGNNYTSYFIGRFDSNGNIVEASNLIDAQGSAIVIEEAHNYKDGFIINGTMEPGTVNFGNQSLTVDSKKAFIVFYNFDGTSNWAKSFDFMEPGFGNKTIVATKGDSLFAKFNSGEIHLLDNSGNDLLTYELFGAEINSLIAGDESLYVGGHFYNSIYFKDMTLDAEGSQQAPFVASLSISTQNANWAVEGSNISNVTPFAAVNQLRLTQDSKLIAAGILVGDITWDDVSGFSTTGVFLSSFSTDGTYLSTNILTDEDGYAIDNGLNNLTITPDSIYFALYNTLTLNQWDYSLDDQTIRTIFTDGEKGNIEDVIYVNDKIYLTGKAEDNLFLITLNADPVSVDNIFEVTGYSGIYDLYSTESDYEENTVLSGYVNGKINFYGNDIISSDALLLAKKSKQNDILWSTLISNSQGSDGIVKNTPVNRADGSIYLLGSALNDFKVGNQAYPDIDGKSYLASFKKDGSLNWITSLDQADTYSLTLDGEGSIYVSGSFTSTWSIGGSTYEPANSIAGFIVKYTATGQFEWFKQFDTDGIYLLSVAANGNTIAFGGEFYGTQVKFDGITLDIGESDGNNILGSFDADGNYNWQTTFGGDGDLKDAYPYTYSDCWLTTLNVDDEGSIYLNGITGRTNVFGDTTLTSPHRFNHFAAKYDNTGKLNWGYIARIEGGFSANYSQAAVDDNHNYYIQGTVRDSVTFDADNGFEVVNERGAYVLKLDASGIPDWVYYYEGSMIKTRALTLHSEDNLEIGGEADPYLSLSQNYDLYGGRSYIMKLCDKPSISQPSGPQITLNTDTIAYSTTADLTGLSWKLQPTNAGKIIEQADGSIKIAWDNNYTGEAEISASSENYCGTGTSTPLIVTVQAPGTATGLDDELSRSISIYPNPVSDQLNVSVKELMEEDVKVTIYDLYGKQVMKLNYGKLSPNTDLRFDVSFLSKGSYMLVIDSGEQSLSRLIVKE